MLSVVDFVEALIDGFVVIGAFVNTQVSALIEIEIEIEIELEIEVEIEVLEEPGGLFETLETLNDLEPLF